MFLLKSKKMRATLLAAAFVLSAAAGAADKYVLISHAPDSDSWWNVIKNSIKEAGQDFKVQVDYRNPANGDIADMARLIEQAAAANYNGVIATIADFNVLKGAIGKVTAKNIPLITINSGTEEQSHQLGAIMHVGQTEYIAGKGAGERAKADGIKNFLCVNQYATNPASFERCRGFAEVIGADYKASTIDAGIDPAGIEAKVQSYLRANPGTQAVLALGPDAAHPTLKTIDKMGLTGKVWFATFDVSNEIVKGIKDGKVKFAIDQQPYLQGYIPVAVFANLSKVKDLKGEARIAKLEELIKANPAAAKRFKEYGLAPVYTATGILSGPGFITKDNVGLVEKFAGRYR